MSKRKKGIKKSSLLIVIIIILVLIYNFYYEEINKFVMSYAFESVSYNLEDIPQYSGNNYVVINNNEPFFEEN